MNSIVVNFQPFCINQKIFLYSDGDILETAEVPMEKVSDVIKAMQCKFQVNKIDLIGNSDYLTKFKNNLKTDYALTEVSINIIGR